jgi:hypothetical protein
MFSYDSKSDPFGGMFTSGKTKMQDEVSRNSNSHATITLLPKNCLESGKVHCYYVISVCPEKTYCRFRLMLYSKHSTTASGHTR